MWLKVSPDRREAVDGTRDPWFTRKWFILNTTAAPDCVIFYLTLFILDTSKQIPVQ